MPISSGSVANLSKGGEEKPKQTITKDIYQDQHKLKNGKMQLEDTFITIHHQC